MSKHVALCRIVMFVYIVLSSILVKGLEFLVVAVLGFIKVGL